MFCDIFVPLGCFDSLPVRTSTAFRSVVAFGPRGDRSRDLILNLIMEKFDLSLMSTFSGEKQIRAVLQVKLSVFTVYCKRLFLFRDVQMFIFVLVSQTRRKPLKSVESV
jgi:hypothetical protein